MTEETVNNGSASNGDGRPSSGSWLLVAIFWTYVTVPLAWGVYKTFGGIAGLFGAA